MTRSYRCYPVRIDGENDVWTLDGVKIGGPDMAKLIRDGFAKATPEARVVPDEVRAEAVAERIEKRGRAG